MKSNVSDHLEMVQAVYTDACAKCLADVFDLRDLLTIRSRVEQEGFSFLTITLPKFCADFERSLADGFIGPTAFREFGKTGAIPALLQGMLDQLFDRKTGRILDNEENNDETTIVDSVRQVCLTFKKIEVECSPARVQRSLSNFVAVERSFEMFSASKELVDEYSSICSVLWDNMLGNLCFDMLVPRHGPGATADALSGNGKFRWRTWHDRIEPYFPLIGNAYSIGVIGSEELDLVTITMPEDELPVKVVCVPKTLKGPRIIAIEPCCVQYAQQAIRAYLYDTLESSRLAAGHVNFRDQSVNQKLALVSSYTGQFATIDLSDASDRVPLSLALEMFRSNPDLQGAIDACRTRYAKLPDGSTIGPLHKFASMGSALCFPIESMYFYTICVAALLKAQNLPVTHANAFVVSRGVHVYGDDLVVPSAYASTVLDYLQKYYCKVNSSKTFVTGRFRESCGVDAYKGEQVTPVYLRKLRPKNRQQASEIISWTASGNAFYRKGYWRTAQLIFKRLEQVVGPMPYVSEESSGLGRFSYLGYRSVERWNKKLHRFEVKALVPYPVYRTDVLEGYGALTKCLSRLDRRYDDPTPMDVFPVEEFDVFGRSASFDILDVDPLHLERSALRGEVTLHRRWVPAT